MTTQSIELTTEWLVGGGEMGRLIRSTDFRATPLGPRERWPATLRHALALVLDCRFPSALLWGRELAVLYNDAGRLLAADRHPGALGRPLSEAWPAVWQASRSAIAAVTERGEPVQLVDQRYPIDRRGRADDAYFSVSYGPVRHESGAIAGAVVVLFETTSCMRARRTLEDQRDRAEHGARRDRELFTKVVERLPVMVSVYDPTDGATHFNPELQRVLGWTDDDARTLDLLALCYPDPAEREKARAFLESAESGWQELAPRAKDGTVVPSSWATVRLSDDTRVTLGIDLPAQRRANEQLRDAIHLAEIERRHLEESEARLREAIERLAATDRNKTEFLAVLSHELRNPLAPIRQSVYLLERAGVTDEVGRRALEVIRRQVDQVTRLVDDLLDVTRISAGKVTLRRERIDLGRLVRGVVDDHRASFANAGVALELELPDDPVYVDGDPARLVQVVGNLLHNSMKFTPRGGTTRISVSAADQVASVHVRDDGVGFAPVAGARLFEPFTQGPQSLARGGGGLGLGLALVKGLVEMQGGTVIGCSEGENRGAEFVVTFPVAPPPETSTERRADARPSKRRVLIVEDNVDAADTLRDLLELHGHEVAVAYTGPEGVEKARAGAPEVVLCDIGLPGLDGYGVARTLRASTDPRLRSAYLVALSGYAQPTDIERSMEAGFDQHIAKPPSFDVIERLLAAAPAPASAP